MEFLDIQNVSYDTFHELLNGYYRDGEDADTPQSQIDEFIAYLHDLCLSAQICGCIACDRDPVGFVLWTVDSADGVFSQKPGYGTILEIGIIQTKRAMGIGKELAAYAESRMMTGRYYVCAYGPAEHFWSRCGYVYSGEVAENGLKIMVKGDENGR